MFITGGSLQSILSEAMHATSLRHRVHSHNVANSDTPNFKKSEVTFEGAFRAAIDDYMRTGVLDFSRAQPVTRRIHTHLETRIDGNNVDPNEENTLVYKNSIMMDMLINSYLANKQLHRTVMDGIN